MKKYILITIAILLSFFCVERCYSEIKISKSSKWQQSQFVQHKYFSLSYVEEIEQAEWVYYELTAEETKDNVKRKDCFRGDNSIITGSALPSDYVKSGYHKGHLANCDDFLFSSEAMRESFLMSNISPQLPKLNCGGAWRQAEKLGETLSLQIGKIEIVTGTFFSEYETPKYIGRKNKVRIPTGFWKIFYSKENNILLCYIFLQSEIKNNLALCKADITLIEHLTGLSFLFE